jgi:RimJ/RimL family protein N-acetyltransferase
MGLIEKATQDGPFIETARLSLRQMTCEDLEASFSIWSDPDVTRFITGAPLSREDVWARLLRHLGHWSARSFGYWAVIEKRSGTYIGEMGLADFRRDIVPSLDGTLEMGWVLSPPAQGNGFAQEALQAIMDWAGKAQPAKPFTSMITGENGRSIALAEKLGFSFWTETTYRQAPVKLYRRDAESLTPRQIRP